MLKYLAPLLLFVAPALAEEPAKCDMKNPQSVCEIKLTVADLMAINTALNEAPVPYKTWGPSWGKVVSQIGEQQSRGQQK